MGQHVVKYVNLTLLILYPISWFSPLMSAGLLPLFGMSEITIVSGILTLWQDDPFLSLIVVLFAVLLPIGKTLCKAAIDFGLAPKSWTHTLAVLSRFAMAPFPKMLEAFHFHLGFHVCKLIHNLK